jgi:twinkle protein
VSGNATSNERQSIDELMTRLRTEVVQQTGCSLHVVSHLTRPDGKPLEEGAKVTLSLLRGSGSIAQLSDAVVAVERNTQDEEPSKRDLLTLRVLKDRLTGSSGVATLLQFNRQTGRMTELENQL